MGYIIQLYYTGENTWCVKVPTTNKTKQNKTEIFQNIYIIK